MLKPICFLKLVSAAVSKFSFFSCSITHTSHSSSYRCEILKATENKRRKGTSNSRNIFSNISISTFHFRIVKFWFLSCEVDSCKCFFSGCSQNRLSRVWMKVGINSFSAFFLGSKDGLLNMEGDHSFYCNMKLITFLL